MMKDFRFIKAFVFCVLFVGFVSSPTVTAQSTQSTQDAKNAIQGSWEIQTNTGLQVIYFSAGGIFVIYKNGIFYIDGSYSIERQENQTQRVVLNFGIFDRMDNVYSFNISANQLVLLDRHRGTAGDGNNILLSLGTYRRSSFVNSETGNPLVGTWKSGESNGEIYRFYSNGEGTLFTYKNEPEFTEKWLFRISYKSLEKTGTGEISIKAFNENWSYGVVDVIPFTINGNVLRVEYKGGTGEFKKQ